MRLAGVDAVDMTTEIPGERVSDAAPNRRLGGGDGHSPREPPAASLAPQLVAVPAIVLALLNEELALVQQSQYQRMPLLGSWVVKGAHLGRPAVLSVVAIEFVAGGLVDALHRVLRVGRLARHFCGLFRRR